MFLEAPAEGGDASQLYRDDELEHGQVLNHSRLWAWRPELAHDFAHLRESVTEGSTLTTREVTVLVCATASATGDAASALRWGKRLSDRTDPSTAAAVMRGSPSARLSARERALSRWARKVAYMPGSTVAADVERLRAAGFSDREIFEATALIAFRVAFSTVNDALGTTPDAAARDTAPAELRAAVDFGRAAVDEGFGEPPRRAANSR